MNKKLQVFVSSTYTDLIEERQAAVEAILDAGHIPADMELFKAGKSQMKTIQKWIDESDVYMLILGGRYGSIEEESGLSYTELEYKYALSTNMPVFAIVLNDSFLFTKAAQKGKNAIFEEKNIDKYELFKQYVETNIVKFVQNTEQIPTVVHSHLSAIINDSDYNLIGWVRANDLYPATQFGNFTFTQIDKLLRSKQFDFTSYYDYCNVSKQDDIICDARTFFINNYNILCDGIHRNRWEDEVTIFYDIVAPFFINIGILKEEHDERLDPRFKDAYITPDGMKLYAMYSSEL